MAATQAKAVADPKQPPSPTLPQSLLLAAIEKWHEIIDRVTVPDCAIDTNNALTDAVEAIATHTRATTILEAALQAHLVDCLADGLLQYEYTGEGVKYASISELDVLKVARGVHSLALFLTEMAGDSIPSNFIVPGFPLTSNRHFPDPEPPRALATGGTA